MSNEDPIPTCPVCGLDDLVEESVDPDNWDGYCYRCMAPFVVEAVSE